MRLILMIWFLAGASAFARLGDTHEQAQERYGLEKREGVAKNRSGLLEGAREVTFEHQGWRIRCALLRATDGQEYVVREEYTKIWNSNLMKAGGSLTIRDFEFEAVLEGERSNLSWRRKIIAKPDKTLASALGNQAALSMGLMGTVLIREDGAVAHLTLGRIAIHFHLPHALKYEAQLMEIKEQKARAALPKF